MNKKKLMALLLTGVMAASTVSVPVFAEEAEGGSSDEVFLRPHHLLLDRLTSPRNSVDYSTRQFRISRSQRM